MTRHCLKDKVVYIASPYRSSSNAIQQYRYVQSCMVAARLMEEGQLTEILEILEKTYLTGE